MLYYYFNYLNLKKKINFFNLKGCFFVFIERIKRVQNEVQLIIKISKRLKHNAIQYFKIRTCRIIFKEY